MFNKILLPVDGSDQSVEAARVAMNIADKHQGSVTFLYVIRPYAFEYARVDTGINPEMPILPGGSSNLGQQIAEKVLHEVQMSGIECNIELGQGDPAKVICDTAQKGSYDLIVMGSRGLGGVGSVVLGSVSNKVSHLAFCPVLLARLGRQEEHKIIKETVPNYDKFISIW